LREKRWIQASAKLTKINFEITRLCESYLPYALAGSVFPQIREQLSIQRKSSQKRVLVESAEELTQKIINAIDQHPPIVGKPLRDTKATGLDLFAGRKLLNREEVLVELNNYLNSHSSFSVMVYLGRPFKTLWLVQQKQQKIFRRKSLVLNLFK
jgi:hypothetical protein